MPADEARRLATIPGMTIGAHGVNHLLLPAQSPEVRIEEMRGSREALERAIAAPVTLFAYPYGGVDRETADAARREFAFALDCRAAAVSESFDAARVPRLDVKAWSIEDLAARIRALHVAHADAESISFLP